MTDKEPKIVRVEWIDSASGRGYWDDLEDVKDVLPIKCVTVGFLVADDATHKTLAGSLTWDQAGGTLTIPKVAIRSVRILK